MDFEKDVIKYYKNGEFNWDWSSRYENSNCFDLFITVRNVGYVVATYYKKSKKLTLIVPQYLIPPCNVLREFMKLCEDKE